MKIFLKMLGELSVFHDGIAVDLPASKRTRALLAYLAKTAKPHRRERLCEVFWETPDDPRGALRWSLSKLRPLVNDTSTERLVADRERAGIAAPDIEIDINILKEKIVAKNLTPVELASLADSLQQPFLDGIDLPDQELFQQWLTAERQEIVRLQGKVLARLSSHPDINLHERLNKAREWEALEPLNPNAATQLLTLLDRLGHTFEVTALTHDFARRFHNAGITWSPNTRSEIELTRKVVEENNPTTADVDKDSKASDLIARQKIHFCTSDDGVRIAYSSVGEGPPIIKAANWLSHLEHDWDAPIWSPLFRDLASDHHFVRYDKRGNGLSDWNVDNMSFEKFVSDLETVVSAVKIDKFALLGISQGAAASIEYAVRHPERVSHLILFGGYAAGWRIDSTDDIRREHEALMTLTEVGWGKENPACRQIFSSIFMPSATPEELSWFNEFQRLTTSAENAVRFLSISANIDVRERLKQVKVPTLVIHSLGDQRIPVETARDIAATIPNAEFIGLDSSGHLLLGREDASKVFVESVRNFIARKPQQPSEKEEI
ncbi:alpha/beta hydrolase [Microbulbifer sp. VAAF005]|uniref:alpha/beta hydrolase n=1 Tax=Microbulbifer sp. VAAF005 TaxID=3034230 RepID=UPI0024ADC780|nr:alpha/beta hydrolase [Microbulbifer sp. VAAF005]WHI46043.1 alpha/beta fold hydrolase [Microbulbifer sp. VAAF005]